MKRLLIIRKYDSRYRKIYLVRETQVLREYHYHLGVIVEFYYKKKLTNKIIRHLLFNYDYYNIADIYNRPYYQNSWNPLTEVDILDAFGFSEDKFYIKEFNIKTS